MRKFIAAIRFLTIIPVPGRLGTEQTDISGSLLFFPVVGFIIGAVAAGFSLLFLQLFAPAIAAVLTIIILLTASGGLHIDGLCDSADGFLSSRPREQMLVIMRDSKIGVMGVMAIILVVGLKIAALASVEQSSFWRAVWLAPIAGRCGVLVMMAVLPYVRSEGGLASMFYKNSRKNAAFGVIAFLFTVAWLIAGSAGVIAAGISFGFILIFAGYCRYKINGTTGDTLGAGCELAETSVLLTFAAEPIMAMIEAR
jgi:adenosylcobinamide-GDP ribazoletransferase